MVTLHDLYRQGFHAVPAALGWTLAAWGLGKAIFRGPAAGFVRRRLERHYAPTLAAMRQAQRELRADHAARSRGNGQTSTAGHKETGANPSLTTALSDDLARTERQRVIAEGWRRTWALRMVDYLMSCPFCQAFWAAVLLYLAGGGDARGLLPTCLACATAGVVVDRLLWGDSPSRSSPTVGSNRLGTEGCAECRG